MAVHHGGKVGRAGKILATQTSGKKLKVMQAKLWHNIRQSVIVDERT